MNIRALPGAAVLAGSLAACAASGMRTTYVAPLSNAQDARTLANNIAMFVVRQVPDRSKPIFLVPSKPDNAIAPMLAHALEANGYQIGQHGHRLVYWVTPLAGGELVRMQLDDAAVASRLFSRHNGQLRAVGPYAVREG